MDKLEVVSDPVLQLPRQDGLVVQQPGFLVQKAIFAASNRSRSPTISCIRSNAPCSVGLRFDVLTASARMLAKPVRKAMSCLS